MFNSDEFKALLSESSLAFLRLRKSESGGYIVFETTNSIQSVCGYESNEIEGRYVLDIIYGGDAVYVSELINTLNNRKEAEFRVIGGEGTVVWVKGCFKKIAENEIVCFMDKLSDDENRVNPASLPCDFDEMFVRHSAIMLLIDPDSKTIIDVNNRAVRFYGYDREQMRGMSLFDIDELPKDVVLSEMDSELHLSKRYFITRHRLQSGEVRDVEVFSTPLRMSAKLVFFSIIRDITQKKHVEKKLEERTLQLQELNTSLSEKIKREFEKRMQQEQLLIQQSKLAAMGEMVGAIAHQWRQPLNTLGLLLQDIEDAYEHDEADKAYVIKNIEKGMQQIMFMSKTIDDFRNFFVPSKEKLPFDICESLFEVLYLMTAQLRNNAVDLSMELSYFGRKQIFDGWPDEFKGEMIPSVVNGYKNEFKQVIMNLLDNAKDAIVTKRLEGGYRIGDKPVITVGLDVNENSILLSVKDNGGGIPVELRERIFEPYFTTKDEGRGTGIGLYMSRTIVESNMGGKINVEVADGETKFSIVLSRCKWAIKKNI